MRRNYISPEFTYTRINGTYNMLEQSSFFGSKMLKISDSIVVGSQNIVYYQNSNSEQTNLSIESSLPPVVYSPSSDKQANSTLVVDPSQSSFQMDNNTAYVLTVDLSSIFNDYVFATLKQYRTFNGVTNAMCDGGDIDFSINDYISQNIVNRYQFNQIQLYLTYNDLTLPGIVNPLNLRFQNIWDDSIESTGNLMNSIIVDTETDQSSTTVYFNQQQPSISYSFNYYFDVSWNII